MLGKREREIRWGGGGGTFQVRLFSVNRRKDYCRPPPATIC